MDYQNQILSLNRTFIIVLTISIVSTLVLIILLFFVRKLKFNPDIVINPHEQWNRMIQFISYVLLSILIIFSSIHTGKIMLDIPRVLSKEYIVDVCVITKHDSSGLENAVEYRGIGCTSYDDNSNNYNLIVTYAPIKIGEKYRVIYLPHSRLGVVIEKITE
jgi:hypothetical protein